MNSSYKYFFLLFLFFSPGFGKTQPDRIYMDHITTEEGLSQNDINCTLQDKNGFMWFGTHDGLNRYDGYNFELFKPDVKNPNSISSNLIQALAEDQQGNIWIGTTGAGLDRYDPLTKQFLNFGRVPGLAESLPNNHIRNLFVDKKNRLWVATIDGVCFIDLTTNSTHIEPKDFQFHFQSLPDELKQGHFNQIGEDVLGNIWLGGFTGLFKLSFLLDSTFNLTRYPIDTNNPNLNVLAFLPYLDDYMLVGTNQGLYFRKVSKETSDSATPFIQISNLYFSNFEVDNFNQVWAGSNQGLYRFRWNDSRQFPELGQVYTNDLSNSHSLNKDVISSLFKDKYGVIWVGTNGGGINKFDPEKKPFLHVRKTLEAGSLSYDKVRSIFEDSENNLWIGTEGGGLNRLRDNPHKSNYASFYNYPLPNNVFAITELEIKGKPYLFFGGQDNPSLYRMPIPNKGEPVNFNDVEPYSTILNSTFSLLNDQNEYLWIGTYNGGLYRIPIAQIDEIDSFSPFRFDPQNSQGISNNIIRSLHKDQEGNIWVGTGNGLNKISANQTHSEQPDFIKYTHATDNPNSISHNYILALHESADGSLWVGTFGGGLNKLVSDGENNLVHFIRYDENDGLANNVVKGILEDSDGVLWITTNKGLSRFDPQTKEFKNYDTSDGLQSAEFSELACLKRKNGEMLFGGVNGFNAFFPENIQNNSYPPEVVFTRFHVLNREIAVGEKRNGRVILPQAISQTRHISLNYDENSFAFEFSALHYSAPEKNQYLFKLEGFDEEWIAVNSQKRFATYTNLRPGDYTIMVKASNNDGIWNEAPASITLHISPPIWRTWWAYLFYLLLILGLLWAFRRYTIIGIKEKHQFKLEHLEKEKAEELHQIKLQFFTNISHELRTPLTLISGPMDYLIKAGKGLDYDDREHQYHLIKKNTNYLLRLINQLLDFRKLDRGKVRLNVQYGDILRFIHEITEPFQFTANKRHIEYKIVANTSEIWAWFDSDILEKTLYNLLSNAFKFTPSKGKVSVTLEVIPNSLNGFKNWKKGSTLEISVADTGPGISPDEESKVFDRFFKETRKVNQNKSGTGIGLAYTKELIELHRGIIKIESQVGNGTKFIVSIPMDADSYEKTEISKVPFSSVIQETDPLAYLSGSQVPNDTQTNTLEPANSSQSELPSLLIVDDNEDIRSYVRQTLAKLYNVFEAKDGIEGCEMSVEKMPDLIISDVMMPRRNGIELCEVIKNDPKTSHIPIILLTAKSSEESELAGLKNGADAYIRKPFNPESLLLRVSNILKHRDELKNRFRREMILEPEEVTVTSTDENFLKKAMDIVEEHMADPDFNVERMVIEIGMSRSKLYLKLKALTGQSSSEFIRTVRLKRAVQLLESSDLTVKEIMYMTGFNTASYFSKCFKKQFGMVPSEYVKREPSRQQ